MASSAQKEPTKNLELCKFGIQCRFYPHCHSHHDFTNTPACKKIVDGKCTFSGICKYAHPKNCIFNKSEGKTEGLSDEERMEMRLLELQLKAMRAASAKRT